MSDPAQVHELAEKLLGLWTQIVRTLSRRLHLVGDYFAGDHDVPVQPGRYKIECFGSPVRFALGAEGTAIPTDAAGEFRQCWRLNSGMTEEFDVDENTFLRIEVEVGGEARLAVRSPF